MGTQPGAESMLLYLEILEIPYVSCISKLFDRASASSCPHNVG